MRLEDYHARLRRRRVAKLRQARQMLRAGYTVAAIVQSLGLTTSDVAGQRRLMTLIREPHRIMAQDFRGGGARRASRSSKGRAEVNGDLCDILSANPSHRDFRFGFTGFG